jgi:uncharacterized protein YjbI with pentapeptide repeats
MNIIIYILLLILILFIINEFIDNKYKKETYETLENNQYINSHCLDNNSILLLNNTLNNLSTNELQNLLKKQNITYDDIIQYNTNQKLNKQEVNDQEVNNYCLNKQEVNNYELNNHRLNKQDINKQEVNNHELNNHRLNKQEFNKQEINNIKNGIEIIMPNLNNTNIAKIAYESGKTPLEISSNINLNTEELKKVYFLISEEQKVENEFNKQDFNKQDFNKQDFNKQDFNKQDFNKQDFNKQDFNKQEINNIKNGIEIIMPNLNNTNIAKIAYESGKTPLGISSIINLNMEELQKVENEYNNIFNKSILSESILNDSILSKSILSESILSDSMLSKSILSDSILSDSILSKSILSDSILSDSILSKSILSESILSDSILSDSILSKSILSDSILNKNISSENILSDSILNKNKSSENISSENISSENISSINISSDECNFELPSKIIKNYFYLYINYNDCNTVFNINDLCKNNVCSQTSNVIINIWTNIYSIVLEIIKIEMNILIELKKKIIEKKLLVTFFFNLINKYNELIEQLLICTNIVQAYNFNNIFFCSTTKFQEKIIIEIIYLKKCVSNLKIINNLIQNYNDIIILNDIIIISDKFNNFINNL